MWLFTKHGMLSAVSKDGQNVCLRARKRQHLVDCLTRGGHSGHAYVAYIAESPPIALDNYTLDYRFRVSIPRITWHILVAALAADVFDYGNFKDGARRAHPDDDLYHDALHEVWEICKHMQQKDRFTGIRAGRPARYETGREWSGSWELGPDIDLPAYEKPRGATRRVPKPDAGCSAKNGRKGAQIGPKKAKTPKKKGGGK